MPLLHENQNKNNINYNGGNIYMIEWVSCKFTCTGEMSN